MFRWTLLLLCVMLTCMAMGQALPALIPYVDSNGKWGYCNPKGEIKIKPQWQGANFFDGRTAVVLAYKGGLEVFYATIDTDGNYIIPPYLHWTGNYNGWGNSFFNAHNDNGHWGMIDDKGRIIIPVEYEQNDMFPYLSRDNMWHKPAMAVRKNGIAGIVDTQGHVLIPFEYDFISLLDFAYLDSNFIRVRKGGKDYIIDYANKIVLPAKYDRLDREVKDHNGLLVMNNNNWGYLSYPSLKEELPPEYESILLADSVIIAKKDGKFGLLDHNFRERLPFIYTAISVENGSARVEKTEKIRDNKTAKEKTVSWFRHYDIHSFQPTTEWTKDKPEYHMHQDRMCCCIEQTHDDRQASHVPEVYVNGKALTTFMKDSMVWHTQSKQDDGILVYGNIKNNGAATYSAIINRGLNYILKPLPGPYWVVDFNKRDALITVTKNGEYGIIDEQLKEVFPFQKRKINYGFKWKGKVYAMVTDAPTQEGNTMYGGQQRIIAANGKYVAPPAKYKIRAMCDEDGRPAKYPCMWVTDTAGNLGMLTATGEVLDPAISFKYKILSGVGEGLFLGPNKTYPSSYQGQLYDKHNKLLFPKLSINLFQEATIESTSNYRNSEVPVPHIYKVKYTDDKGMEGMFYMNGDGRVYSDISLN